MAKWMKLIKKFWGPKKPGRRRQQHQLQTFQIRQFAMNDRLGHFDQLIIVIEMIQMLCNGKTDETDEKIVKAKINQGDGDSNTDS